LLLRLVVGAVLLVRAGSLPWSELPLPTTLTGASLAGAGMLLIAGLWTPLVGAAVAAIELAQLLITAQDPVVRLLAGTVGGALALLGPGRWSVDARLFGWKRIDASPRRRPSHLP
jgi:hypothetical protein